MEIQCSGERRDLIIVDIFVGDRRFADPRERRGQSVRQNARQSRLNAVERAAML